MHRLSDQALLSCYTVAVKSGADRNFIQMLLNEIKKRELELPKLEQQTEQA